MKTTQAACDPSTARVDGFAPIGAYGAIGDGRATALVALDGSVDWLCLPAHDSGSVFGALLDPGRGGSFELGPDGGAREASQRYLDGSNVLETTIRGSSGTLRITDAMTTDGGRILPWNELVRRVECVAGSVALRWRVRPRFGYGQVPVRLERVAPELVLAHSASGMLAILAWDAGEPAAFEGAVEGGRELRAGDEATLTLAFAAGTPLAIPRRSEAEDRLERTAAAWREWLRAHDYDGAWRKEVERSLLALQLLTSPTTGAVIAAPTTSLPERIGGDRNYDYRHAWPRDAAFTLDALLHCELREPSHRSFAWLLGALADTHPRVAPIYRLSGEVLDHEIEVPLGGYRGSRPVRDGNAASTQLQLGVYGDLMHTAWMYTRLGNRLDPGTAARLADNADLLCEIWDNEDASIWELPERRHYTVSKMGSWLALERALQLVEAGQLPGGRAPRWRRERRAIARWVEERCWSPRRRSYTMHPGTDALDVACLLMGRMGYDEVAGERFGATLDAVRAELMDGPCAYRYSGMQDEEGAFVACSFWIAEALARDGRIEEACELVDGALRLGNHLGLFAEEVDPGSGELLGNFPQGLSHLSLINAAATIGRRITR